jgi:hypothetical protein
MTSNDTLYSTIATLIGVWISIIISLSIALFTFINTQNTHFFTSLRDEKKSFVKAIDYIINDVDDFCFSRVYANNSARDRGTKTLNLLDLMCNESETENIDNLNKNIDNIYNCMKIIIFCYPHLEKLGYNFLFTENLPINDDKYESWLKDYKYRINFDRANKTFKRLYNYFDNISRIELHANAELKISTLKDIIDKLRIIDKSLNEIETLKRDYKPIVFIFEIIKSKITIGSILGTLIFGVLLPVYMLLPNHLDLIPENWLILGIFAGLAVCCCVTFFKIKQIIYVTIRE